MSLIWIILIYKINFVFHINICFRVMLAVRKRDISKIMNLNNERHSRNKECKLHVRKANITTVKMYTENEEIKIARFQENC